MTTLIESKAKAFGSSKGLVVSMALHGGLVALALYGTSKVVLPPREKVEEHKVLYVATPPPPPKEVYVAPKPLPKVKAPPQAKAAPRLVVPQQRPRPAAPQPKVAATPALVAPTSVSATIPDIDLKAVATISDVVAPPVAEPVAASGPPSGGSTVRGKSDGDVGGGLNSGGNSGKAFDESQVDRTVEVRRAVVPRFPESLRSVNVTGNVTVRYIVSADGKVEPGSIEVISTPHKLFADAVRTALLNTRYRPAEAGGKPVRQLVEQSFQFKLSEGD